MWFCPLCQEVGYTSDTAFCPNDGARVRPIGERGAEWVGKVLADRYRVLRFLDAGGTAEVFEAERIGTAKRVALKLLQATRAQNGDAGERFESEARMVSLVAHPNIVAIEDFGTLPSGVHYMVMELLTGESLGARVRRAPLPPELALKLAMQACEGLAAAHARGVVHCDVKPENLFAHRPADAVEPTIKILDLGIGRMLGRGDGGARGGLVSGTPAYMSPEQVQGRPLGPASDIYSMGITIWELLFRSVPFDHDSYARIFEMHRDDSPVWPTRRASELGVPSEVERVVLKALAKDPAQRQASMLELQMELARAARELRARDRAQAQSSAPPTSMRDSTPAARDLRASSAPLSRPRAQGGTDAALARVRLADATGADDEVVEIAPDTYWVGRRRGQQLECNAYLRVFRDGARSQSLLIDPGPPEDLEIVTRKVSSVIGSLRGLDFVFINHQDPDVASNAAAIQQQARLTHLLCSEDTFRLARFYGLDARRFVPIERAPGGVFSLSTGHTIQFVPTPFCHFRGAVMVYDPATRVLFSGDLFGGARAAGLVADERSWPGIEMFHQIYMPSQKALALAAGRVMRLSPRPTTVAPQHGAVLVGDEALRFVERVGRLEVGLDMPESEEQSARYVAAANDLVRELREVAGADRARELLAGFAGDLSFTRLFVLDDAGAIASFKAAPRLALEAFANDVLAALPADLRGDLRRSFQLILRQQELQAAPPSSPASARSPARR